MKTTYSIAKECQDYIDQNISFKRNKIHSDRVVFTDYDIVGNIKQLEILLIDFHGSVPFCVSTAISSKPVNFGYRCKVS